MNTIKTDILIIGAGPVGLFTVFEAGLLGLKCHLIDALAQPGGQCAEIYPKKPIYDIPGMPEVMAGDLVNNLLEQIKPFAPGYSLGERAEKLIKKEDGSFDVITSSSKVHNAKVVAIAGGLGSFEPRKPPIDNIVKYEARGVEYMVKDPENFKNKKIVIAGGGDSALDWTIELAKIAKKVTLIIVITHNNEKKQIDADFFIPLFGLVPRLGSISDWGLNLDKNSIIVNNGLDYQTNIPGVFAIGDINTYPGKLKLILCGFHEATLMCQSAYKIIHPNKKNILKYTTVSGIKGFDGTNKKSENSIIKTIS